MRFSRRAGKGSRHSSLQGLVGRWRGGRPWAQGQRLHSLADAGLLQGSTGAARQLGMCSARKNRSVCLEGGEEMVTPHTPSVRTPAVRSKPVQKQGRGKSRETEGWREKEPPSPQQGLLHQGGAAAGQADNEDGTRLQGCTASSASGCRSQRHLAAWKGGRSAALQPRLQPLQRAQRRARAADAISGGCWRREQGAHALQLLGGFLVAVPWCGTVQLLGAQQRGPGLDILPAWGGGGGS